MSEKPPVGLEGEEAMNPERSEARYTVFCQTCSTPLADLPVDPADNRTLGAVAENSAIRHLSFFSQHHEIVLIDWLMNTVCDFPNTPPRPS